ncbi:hypothetical protein AB1Y20_009297 [Prymnesium parvum]|uniref:L-type lectin-like domain-containing protein n=1 Tax=Prymnesium parvum TaxID=97485 RepID=A0AB34JZY5_PRYPA
MAPPARRLALCLALLPATRSAEAPAPSPAAPHVEELPPLPLTQIVPSLSFSNPFQRYPGGVIPGWQYGGAATLSNDYISLTPPSPNMLGWMWSAEPVSLPSWEADLEFHIGGSSTRGAGGGLAFWFTSEQGRAGPIYGQGDKYRGLGIFLDTYESSESGEEAEPFVVAMVNYGDSLVQGSEPDYFKNQVGVCFAGYRNLEYAARARIVKTADRLQVWLDLDHSGHFQNCLQTEPGDARLQLPEKGFFGITASTGAHGDAHVVYQLAIARLSDGEQITSKPFHGIGSTVPAEHLVKPEGRHHETHVPIAKHSPRLDAEGNLVRTAAADVAEPAMVPPSVNANLAMSERLGGVVETLLELANATRATHHAVEDMTLEVRNHMTVELMEAFGLMSEELHVMNQSIVEVLEAQHDQTRLHASENARSTEGSIPAVQSMQRDMAQMNTKCFDRMDALSHDIRKLEVTLASTAKQVGAISTELSQLQSKLLGQLESSLSLQAEAKAAQAKTQEQLAGMKGQGVGNTYTALIVSAQALVLAAFLFYQRIAQKRRDHFL